LLLRCRPVALLQCGSAVALLQCGSPAALLLRCRPVALLQCGSTAALQQPRRPLPAGDFPAGQAFSAKTKPERLLSIDIGSLALVKSGNLQGGGVRLDSLSRAANAKIQYAPKQLKRLRNFKGDIGQKARRPRPAQGVRGRAHRGKRAAMAAAVRRTAAAHGSLVWQK
jgi:hypothetical protein